MSYPTTIARRSKRMSMICATRSAEEKHNPYLPGDTGVKKAHCCIPYAVCRYAPHWATLCACPYPPFVRVLFQTHNPGTRSSLEYKREETMKIRASLRAF